MIAMTTRDAARNVARKVNAVAPAKLKAPVKGADGWIFPGLSHADNKGTLSLKNKVTIKSLTFRYSVL